MVDKHNYGSILYGARVVVYCLLSGARQTLALVVSSMQSLNI